MTSIIIIPIRNIVDERPTKRSISRVYGEALLQLVDVKPVDQSELKVLPEDAVLKQVLHKYVQMVVASDPTDILSWFAECTNMIPY